MLSLNKINSVQPVYSVNVSRPINAQKTDKVAFKGGNTVVTRMAQVGLGLVPAALAMAYQTYNMTSARTKTVSEYHSDVCGSSTNMYIAYVSELEAQGMNKAQIIDYLAENDWHGNKEHAKEFVDKIWKERAKIDKSFKEIIPKKSSEIYYAGKISALEDTGREREVFQALLDAKAGDIVIPDYGYLRAFSTERDGKSYAQFVGGYRTPEEAILLKIITKSGTQISTRQERTWGAGEDNYDFIEAVFPRGREYKVLDKTVNDGRTELLLQEILPTK